MDQNKLKVLQAQLGRAKVNYGVAEKTHKEFMEILKADYGITTLKTVPGKIKTLDIEVHTHRDKRDAYLVQAESILEKPTMENSNGNTKTPNTRTRTERVSHMGSERTNRALRTTQTRPRTRG